VVLDSISFSTVNTNTRLSDLRLKSVDSSLETKFKNHPMFEGHATSNG